MLEGLVDCQFFTDTCHLHASSHKVIVKGDVEKVLGSVLKIFDWEDSSFGY